MESPIAYNRQARRPRRAGIADSRGVMTKTSFAEGEEEALAKRKKSFMLKSAPVQEHKTKRSARAPYVPPGSGLIGVQAFIDDCAAEKKGCPPEKSRYNEINERRKTMKPCVFRVYVLSFLFSGAHDE